MGRDLLLPVQWHVVAVFAYDDLRDQTRSRDTALLKLLGQWRDDGHTILFVARHVFAPDEAAAKEVGWLTVELLGHLRADEAPCLNVAADNDGGRRRALWEIQRHTNTVGFGIQSLRLRNCCPLRQVWN